MTVERRAFTLLELMVALAILGILSVISLSLVEDIEFTRGRRAQADAVALYNGIFGTYQTSGYYGDVGQLPPQPLNQSMLTSPPNNVVPHVRADSSQGIVSAGWQGPYLLGPSGYGGDGMDTDPWGDPWSIDPTTGSIRSAGPDGYLGDQDDIVMPQGGTTDLPLVAPTPLRGGGATASLAVVVLDPATLDPLTGSDILVQVSDTGSCASKGHATMMPTNAPSPGQDTFTIRNLHPGRHLVEAAHIAPDPANPNGYPTTYILDKVDTVAAYANNQGWATVRVVLR